MAVYLYNLGFSASNAATGNFSSGGSGVNASNAWFQYIGQGLPPGAGSNLTQITSVLPASNWTQLTQVPTFNAGVAAVADYLLLRIFSSDNTPGNFLVRATVIFGQGDSASVVANGNLQSPFRMRNGNALPVIDMDGGPPPLPTPPSWPTAGTDASNSTQASWTYCVGQVHNPTANAETIYIFNVGATVFDSSRIMYYSYGIDPRMKVGGMGVPVVADRDKDAA